MTVSIDIPTSEPSEVTAGDTITWKISLSEFLASDSWVLTYALVKDGKVIFITASADGDDHLVEVLPTVTAKYDPGNYYFQAYVTKTTERYNVRSGMIEVLPDFAESTGYDNRSHAKKMYDILSDVLEGKIDRQSYSIGGRSLAQFSYEELIAAQSHYKSLWIGEERKAGRGSSKIEVKFVNPWA